MPWRSDITSATSQTGHFIASRPTVSIDNEPVEKVGFEMAFPL
jgi:hypothetical protein